MISSSEAISPSLIESYLIELKNKKIKGLIVSINSPGGSVSASESVYRLFEKFKDKNNIPLYFHTNGMMASGAYWVALSGNKIYANYGSIIGSIGVKGPDWIYYNSPTTISSGLLGNTVVSPNGIKLYSNIAGKSKDIFNPFRSPSDDEIFDLQKIVNKIYTDFTNKISEKRKIENEFIVNEIGAMIFDTEEAKKNFLIDGEMDLNQLINKMKKKLNLKKVEIIENKNKNYFNILNINNYFNLGYEENFNFINQKFCDNLRNEFSVVAVNYQRNCQLFINK